MTTEQLQRLKQEASDFAKDYEVHPWDASRYLVQEGYLAAASKYAEENERLLALLKEVSELKGIQPASEFYQLPFELMNRVKSLTNQKESNV